MMSAMYMYYIKMFSWILIVLAHWNKGMSSGGWIASLKQII